jgi:hypothetical protein
VQGSASIEHQDGLWLVSAKDCKHLAVELNDEVVKGGNEINQK